jgi:hypothetical protein
MYEMSRRFPQDAHGACASGRYPFRAIQPAAEAVAAMAEAMTTPKTLCARCETDITKRRARWEEEAYLLGYLHAAKDAAKEIAGIAAQQSKPEPEPIAEPSGIFAGFGTLPTRAEWERLLYEEAMRRFGTANKAAKAIGIGQCTMYRKVEGRA